MNSIESTDSTETVSVKLTEKELRLIRISIMTLTEAAGLQNFVGRNVEALDNLEGLVKSAASELFDRQATA